MLISEIEGLASSEAVTQAQRDTEIGKDDFLRMLVAQLENQDPLNPQDGTEFTAQLAQFSSLEQLISMRTAIEDLVTGLSSDDASGVLGGLTGDLLAAGVIGKDVLAAGSQFALDASGRLPRLAFDLEGNTSRTSVVIRDAGGIEQARIALGSPDQGRVELTRDQLGGALEGLPAGAYSFDVDARLGDNPVNATRLTGGRVTATALGGSSPLLMLGDTPVPLTDVVEIREAAAGS